MSITYCDAECARDFLASHLRLPKPWVRGIGIGRTSDGNHYVKVNVALPTDAARLPMSITYPGGRIRVEPEVIGKIVALGQELLPPEGSVESIPEKVQYIQGHLDQPRMQLMVGVGVAAGFALALIGYKALTAPALPEERRETNRGMLKLAAYATAVYGTFYLLDVDKKWWRAETASAEVEKWIANQWK
jgi:hypothetical protein